MAAIYRFAGSLLDLAVLVIVIDTVNADPPIRPCPAAPPCSCYGSTINCGNKSLTIMPTISKVNYTWSFGWTVDLTFNNLVSIPSGAFRNILIHELHISHNAISSIDPDAFGGQEASLEMVRLQSNKLVELPVVLKGMRNLTFLSLQDNPITSYNTDVLRNLTNVQFLDMGSPELSEWPSGLQYMTSLFNLDIYQIGFDNFPDNAFEGFENKPLVLWFDGTQFSKMPSALRVLKNVTDIMINGNRLLMSDSFDSDSFKGMTSLRNLYIDNSSLTEVPDVSQLPNLSDLTITRSDPPLSRWDESTMKLPSKLSRITLEESALNHIPHILSRLESLSFVSFANSPIREIKSNDVAGLRNLTVLSLSGTDIRHIAHDAFREIKNLSYVDLSGTKLQGFPNAFQRVGTIRQLNLFNVTIECSCAELGWMKTWKPLNQTYMYINGECANIHTNLMDYIHSDIPHC